MKIEFQVVGNGDSSENAEDNVTRRVEKTLKRLNVSENNTECVSHILGELYANAIKHSIRQGDVPRASGSIDFIETSERQPHITITFTSYADEAKATGLVEKVTTLAKIDDANILQERRIEAFKANSGTGIGGVGWYDIAIFALPTARKLAKSAITARMESTHIPIIQKLTTQVTVDTSLEITLP